MQHVHEHSSSPASAVPTGRQGFAHPPRNVGVLGIDPGMTVADFGSGSGVYVLLIADALQGSGHVYAVDIQRDLLRRTANEARQRGLNTVEVVWADLEKRNGSKLAPDTLDLVLISNLLFQVEDKSAVLTEARRVLRPKGRLVIIDWSDSFGGMGPQKRDVVTKDAALAFAQASGFTLHREFDAGEHHYGLIFRQAPTTSV